MLLIGCWTARRHIWRTWFEVRSFGSFADPVGWLGLSLLWILCTPLATLPPYLVSSLLTVVTFCVHFGCLRGPFGSFTVICGLLGLYFGSLGVMMCTSWSLWCYLGYKPLARTVHKYFGKNRNVSTNSTCWYLVGQIWVAAWVVWFIWSAFGLKQNTLFCSPWCPLVWVSDGALHSV